MFKFLRKAAEKLGIVKPKKPVRLPSAVRPVLRAPGPKSLNARVVARISEDFANAKLVNVRYRIKFMTRDELQWTLRASRKDIQDKARLKPNQLDRIVYDDDGDELNPWWYK